MPGSKACNGIMYFVPLCYIQIQAELDVSPLSYVAPRKPQHGNSSDVPYMLRFSAHFCNGFYQRCTQVTVIQIIDLQIFDL